MLWYHYVPIRWSSRPRAFGRSSILNRGAFSSTPCTANPSTLEWLSSQLHPLGLICTGKLMNIWTISPRSISIWCIGRYMKFWKSYYCRWNPRMRPQDSVHLRWACRTSCYFCHLRQVTCNFLSTSSMAESLIFPTSGMLSCSTWETSCKQRYCSFNLSPRKLCSIILRLKFWTMSLTRRMGEISNSSSLLPGELNSHCPLGD